MSQDSAIDIQPRFDSFSFEEEGVMYWWASWYSRLLDYRSLKTFLRPMFKAMQACHTLDLDTGENFVEVRRMKEGRQSRDFKLTRFACYLIAMNADGRKPVVARAQVYFADQVEKIKLFLEGSKDLERLLIREDIKDGHHHLTAAAARAGVADFRMFMNEGYIGLYNKPIREIKQDRGLDGSANLYEFMGRTELAANLFRITMTEERLAHAQVNNAFEAAAIHRSIGEDIRQMLRDHTGKFPENMSLERNLHEVTSELKKAGKLLNQHKDAS